ncbi:MAG: DUF4129 domain-containing protein [Microthrixaceae bacterium]
MSLLVPRRGDGPPAPSAQEVKEALSEVLPGRSLLDRAMDPLRRVVEWFADKLPQQTPSGAGNVSGGISAVGYLIVGVLVVLLLVLIVLAVRRWVRIPSGGDADDEPTVVTEELDDPQALASEAERLLSAGQYRAALLATYRQCIAELVVLNWVPKARSRTTGELRGDVAEGLAAEAGSGDGLNETFGSLTDAFEDAWFGGRPVDAAAVQRAAEQGRVVAAAADAAGRATTRRDEGAPVQVIEL